MRSYYGVAAVKALLAAFGLCRVAEYEVRGGGFL